MLRRREFLQAAGGLAAMQVLGNTQLAEARGLLTDPILDELVGRTLRAARRAGASYADVRIVRRRDELVATRDAHIDGARQSESYGIGVRVLARGAWGFAASSQVTADEAERIAGRAVEIALASAASAVRPPVTLVPEPAHVDSWQTPLTRDPFKIPLADKAELLLAIAGEVLKVRGVRFANGHCRALGEWKLLASTDGAYLEQAITRVAAGYRATAVSDRGELAVREHEFPPQQAGWEYIESSPLLGDARRIGEEAVEKLHAPSVQPGRRDLILSPSNLYLTIHETLGHSTELDRALGYEANFAGTSFATPEQRGQLRMGSPLVHVYADRITPMGLATCGYDDDGVRTGRWDLVRDGLLVGFQSTREQAAWIGEAASRGTSYAQDFRSVPMSRMPNVSLAAGKADLDERDLIAATDDGIYIVGDGAYSIDHQRYSFQFGGQMFYEVKKGRITSALKDVAYQGNTLDFWRSCDRLGGARAWRLYGVLDDGKGEPGQLNAVSHGCPPARFAGVRVLNTTVDKRG